MAEVRVRFAPSPTGSLHVGGARTALFNWLFARNRNGSFILRFEDTDIERSSTASEQELLEDLRWLGLYWDEGPDCGGPYKPYRQSERLDLYRKIANILQEKGKAYPCYCTDEELEKRREEALSQGKPPHYDGRCRNLSTDERRKLESQGRKPSLRFLVDFESVSFTDLVRGHVTFKKGMVGDFILIRSDGMPTYNFACVVDDWAMKITHVIRGEEHLSNTLRQILLYESLGWQSPQFAHLPLVLGPDRTKLSKRHGATSISELRKMGFPPEALVNYLALLGWSPGDDRELMTRSELVASFSLERVSPSPSIFDVKKLRWISSNKLKTTENEELLNQAQPFLIEKGYEQAPREILRKAAGVLKDSVTTLRELADEMQMFIEEPKFDSELTQRLSSEKAEAALKLFLESMGDLTSIDRQQIKQLLAGVAKKSSMKKGEFFMPIRIALTGRLKGPELPAIIEVLGKEETAKRIRNALERRIPS